MMLQTDVFFNYIEAYFDIFKAQDGVTLTQAYSLYKEFCEGWVSAVSCPSTKFEKS